MRKGLRVLSLELIVPLAAAFAIARNASAIAPCTDGVLSGNLGPFYRAILGDADGDGVLDPGETPSAWYEAQPEASKRMVRCGADPARDAPDLVRYRERPESVGGLIRDSRNRVVARVYDYLDPATRRFYLAVAMSGCFTDNAFCPEAGASAGATDASYLTSVFWPPARTHAEIESAAPLHLGFRCSDDAGRPVHESSPSGIAIDLVSLAADPASGTSSMADWSTQVESVESPPLPAWTHGTSAWWNLAMRAALGDATVAAAMRSEGVESWDLELGSAAPVGALDPARWKSPFDDPSLLFGRLGWGSTWFSDRYLWEWRQVYEASFAAGDCAGTPDDWAVTVSLDARTDPGKPQNEVCGDDANLGSITVIKDRIPDDPWDRYDFVVSGPTPSGFTLQDPGANECPGDPLCSTGESEGAWIHPDRFTSSGLIASSSLGGAGYRVHEWNPRPGWSVSWECKNAPSSRGQPLDPTCDPAGDSFAFDECAEVTVECAPSGSDWRDGHISCRPSDAGHPTCAAEENEGVTAPFELCAGAHVLCRFTNQAHDDNAETCLEAVAALGDLRVLGDLGPEGNGIARSPVTFTSAAVATPSADGADSIFLASFVPLADQSRWPATIDHFVQPLPVIEDQEGDLVPDRSRACHSASDLACLAWNAAAEILEQAPDPDEVATDRRIGTRAGERRVTYTMGAVGDAVPRAIRAFDYAASDAPADERDLWEGMGIEVVAGDTSSEEAARLRAHDVIRRTLATRTAVVDDSATGAPRTLAFVVGDVFHADPLLLGGPSDFLYLANDLEGNGRSCTDTARPNRGYRCFFERERRRRKVLLAPSNDGQLHAFDAGFFRGTVQGQRLVGRFDLGTGRELFAHIPRPMLAHTRRMTALEHAPGIDGPLAAGDVFIDPVHDGNPTASEREWRTVVIGAYRDGGNGLYALDLTHPDPVQARTVSGVSGGAAIEFVPIAGARAASAVPTCNALAPSFPSGCARPYPMVLWEFSDPDLGASWSKANLGRVRVVPSGADSAVARFVAVFGGGLDSTRTGKGQFLYMVDVETGRTLWKRAVIGAVPSEPSAVDTNRDGVLDTLYVGTTAGYVYKVDLSREAELDAVTGRVEDTSQWRPFRVFDTGGRPLYFRPSVIFDESSGHYAIGFGTGDRSDLWSPSLPGQGGRFYLIVDPGWSEESGTLPPAPFDESSLPQIDADAGSTGRNLLTEPAIGDQRGWVLRLASDERVVSDALAVSGVLTFATFDPDPPDRCAFGGSGKVYTLRATNADALGGAQSARALSIESMAGAAAITSAGWSVQGLESMDPFVGGELRGIRDALLDLFPDDCRFGNFALDVSASSADRELLALARIPVCIARKNWTEHF